VDISGHWRYTRSATSMTRDFGSRLLKETLASGVIDVGESHKFITTQNPSPSVVLSSCMKNKMESIT
jgi:hypothetical protein